MCCVSLCHNWLVCVMHGMYLLACVCHGCCVCHCCLVYSCPVCVIVHLLSCVCHGVVVLCVS